MQIIYRFNRDSHTPISEVEETICAQIARNRTFSCLLLLGSKYISHCEPATQTAELAVQRLHKRNFEALLAEAERALEGQH